MGYDQDVIYFGERKALVVQVNRGVVQEMRLFDLGPRENRAEACGRFLLSRYAEGSPEELIASSSSACEWIGRSLSASYGYRVRSSAKGGGRELLKLCEQNDVYRLSQEETQ